MPLLIFELAFASVALGLLAVVVLIVRNLRRKRAAPAEAKPKGVKPDMPGKSVQAAGPESDIPPQQRRRQLRSLSEVEQSEAEAVVAAEPTAELPAAEPVAAEAPAVEPAVAPIAEPTAGEDPTVEDGYAEAVLAQLEAAFERLEAQEITLDTYTAQLVAEQSAVDRRIADLRAHGTSEELEQALAAAESVRWCLDWAAEQPRPLQD